MKNECLNNLSIKKSALIFLTGAQNQSGYPWNLKKDKTIYCYNNYFTGDFSATNFPL